MPIIDVEQQTADWVTMRVGMCTGSRVADVVTRLKKGGYSAARGNYLMELVVSRLTGLTPDHFVNDAMRWGIEQEQYAVAAYEMEHDVMAEKIGFAMHSKIDWFGASPDRKLGNIGLMEVKCPTSGVHLGYLMEGVVPLEYQPQMLAEMACAEREWVDFVSFDPRMPKKLQLFVKRFHRDEALIKLMEQEVIQFLGEVDEQHQKILANTEKVAEF
jgi:exodeoxyribonuclease (lambda-induced)